MGRRFAARFTLSLLVWILAFTLITGRVCVGKLLGSISITASPSTITMGENVIINGSITYPEIVNHTETVAIWYRLIGEPWRVLATVTTNETGDYSHNWVPTELGTYEVKATWIGDEYAAESPTPHPTVEVVGVHNIVVINVVRSPTEVAVGEAVDVDVTVMNEGHYSESFDVSVYADLDVADVGDEIVVGTLSDVTLTAGASTTREFTWGTTGVAEGTYTISAEASQVPDEINTTDNTRIDGTVAVTPPAAPPVASFTSRPPYEACTGETVVFDASASSDPDGTIASYEWAFGDGNETTGWLVEHAYADDGTYTVTLTVTDDDGLSDTDSKEITVSNRPPTATFTESAETVYTDEPISFDASDSDDPDGDIASYCWDFGDGTNATGVVVEHAYADNGTYTVTLTVTDDDGATDVTSANKTVLNTPPVAVFTASAAVVYTTETVYFNASSSYDPDGSIEGYWWDFGDGSNATGVTAEHSYSQDGNYTVTLTVTDDDAATGTTTAVKAVSNRPPVAAFTESAETVHAGDFITFDASNSNDLDGAIVAYRWDFGDGTYATKVTVNHAYREAGNYTVTLTVTDDDGAAASKSLVMRVSNGSPVALFVKNASMIAVGKVIRFDASASHDPYGAIRRYFWDFGDGTNASMAVVLDHAYVEAGTYTVTLTVTDDDGASSSTSAMVTVNASSEWPWVLIVGVASCIAASAGPLIYALFRGTKGAPTAARKRKKPS